MPLLVLHTLRAGGTGGRGHINAHNASLRLRRENSEDDRGKSASARAANASERHSARRARGRICASKRNQPQPHRPPRGLRAARAEQKPGMELRAARLIARHENEERRRENTGWKAL